MHKFSVYTIATIALAAMFASAPARAEFNYGPVQNAGQCWTTSINTTGSNGGTFGYWGACPAPAAAATATPKHHRRHARS